MLRNDTLKNGTSRKGLYGSAPPGGMSIFFVERHEYSIALEVPCVNHEFFMPIVYFFNLNPVWDSNRNQPLLF